MKILVAEDDTASRIVLQSNLRKWGYKILAAENGQQAWQIMQVEKPKMAIIDWIMPGMDGLELCRRIRHSDNEGYTYIIFLTGKAQNTDIVTALEAGADDYLCKPFDRNVLRSRVAVGVRVLDYEKQLRKSEERYRRIVDCTTDYMYTVRLKDGRAVETVHNDASVAVTGYTPQELALDDYLWINMVHVDDRQAVIRQAEQCIRGKKVEPLEHRIIRKDGRIRWVRSTLVQHFDKTGRLVSYDGLLKDITERKNVEENLRIAKEKAEQAQKKLERANLELEIIYKRLMETSHSAGMAEVATNVLHNVGNALNSINVSAALVAEKITNSEIQNLQKLAEVIQEHRHDLGDFLTQNSQGKHIPTYLAEVSKQLAEEQKEIVSKMGSLIKNVEHMREIIRMQQSYAHSAETETLTDLREVIEQAIQVNHAGLEREGIEVIRDYADITNLLVDRQRILQVLVNLIDNAGHALSRVDQKEKILIIRTKKTQDGKVRIEVSDNGIGIAATEMERIFERGYTTKEHGHGFGLHSCQLAMRNMQGKLTVQSDGIGRGATFSIELPLKGSGVKYEQKK